MSIFASHSQVTIPIPFDAPNTVTIRKLTGREVELAQAAHRDSFLGSSPRLWSSTFRRALEKGVSDPEVAKAIADPMIGFDRFTVVRAGLVGWSYPLPVKRSEMTTTATPVVTVTDPVEDLSDEAVEFIATEILRLTKPALFQTDADREAARKNG